MSAIIIECILYDCLARLIHGNFTHNILFDLRDMFINNFNWIVYVELMRSSGGAEPSTAVACPSTTATSRVQIPSKMIFCSSATPAAVAGGRAANRRSPAGRRQPTRLQRPVRPQVRSRRLDRLGTHCQAVIAFTGQSGAFRA